MSCRTALAIAAALLVSAEGFNAPGAKGGFGAALVRAGGDSNPNPNPTNGGWHGKRRQVNMAAKKKAFEVSEWAADFDEDKMWQDEESSAKQERDAQNAELRKATPKRMVKPMELFLKAGPEGTEIGDCPFAHYVRMVLAAKGVDYVATPCVQETKPQWLVDGYGGAMPALLHDGEAYTESSKIAEYLCFFFPKPVVPAPSAATTEAAGSVFPAIAKFLKNKDEAEAAGLESSLIAELSKIEEHLASAGTPFLDGDDIGMADCSLAPKLYHLTVAAKHFKGWEVPESMAALRQYMATVFESSAFTSTVYPEETVVWGWSTYH